MARSKSNLPTAGELAILRVLWADGPSSVREVHQILQKKRTIGYTTVLKLLQIMTEKGMVHADKTVRPQIFEPVRSRKQTQSQLVGDLLDRAFSGSAGGLILQALSTKKATAEERRQIRELLDRLEEESE